MPAIVSHYLLAQRVIDDLRRLSPEIKPDREAFIWGASGPDLFFCHRLLPFHKERSLSRFGSRMHNEPAHRLLNYLVEYAEANNDDIIMSYALGFITHYAFDAAAHPFVLYYAGQMAFRRGDTHESICHNEIEAALDSLFYKRETGRLISTFRLQDAAPKGCEANKHIACAMCKYMREVYGLNVHFSEIMTAQKDWHDALALLNDPSNVRRKIVRLGERAVGLKPMLSLMFREDHPAEDADFANEKNGIWYAEKEGREHNESFYELANKAEALSVSLIMQVLSGKKIAPEQCEATFSGH